MSHPRQRRWWVRQPGLEALEGRFLLAQFGVPWHDAKHLSISFVPDGTPIAGHGSDLYRTLDARESTAAWQRELLRAFQTWAVHAHVNVALVPDGGQPLGTPGPDQHDPRFGDIRIGAQPMSPEVLSISVPHDPFLSGTWSGDVLLNSNVAFEGGGPGLFPTMLHEAGHVLGLDHSDEPGSVMFSHLDNTRDSLSPGDVSALQALYGARPGDGFGGAAGNHTFQTAAPFPSPAGFDGTTPLLLYGDVSKAGDVDDFSLEAPGGYLGPVTVRLQTAGVSLLAPRLTVYDATGKAIAEASSVTDAGDTLLVTLPRVDPGASYVIEVGGAVGDVFGMGEYALAVNFDSRSAVGQGAIDTLSRQSYGYLSPADLQSIFLDPKGALFHKDAHTNDTFATAEALNASGGYGTEAPDRVTASLGDPSDVDVYHIEAPEASGTGHGGPLVMTVTGRATEVYGLMPLVSVFDDDQLPVPALVLAHGDGTYTVQVADARPGGEYFIRVTSDPGSGKVVGNYELDVEYGHEVATPATFVESTLVGPDAQRSYDLVVNQAQLFDFVLTAGPAGSPAGPLVRVTVTDPAGRLLAVRAAGVGASAGGDPLFLPPGAYLVTFSADPATAIAPAPPIAFRLYGASLSDPIGPALDDPTLRPIIVPLPGGSLATTAPPALGSPGDPYAWLAITLSAPRGQNGPLPATDAPLSAIVSGAGPGRSGPLSPNTQDTALLTTTGHGSVGGSAQGPPPGPLSAPGRPAQSALTRGGLIAAPTAAIRVDSLHEFLGHLGVETPAGTWRVTGRDDVPQAPSIGLAPAAAGTPQVGLLPSPTDPGRSPSREGQDLKVSGSVTRPPAVTAEAATGPAMAPAAVILGWIALAYGYQHRPRVTNVSAGVPFRRASAGNGPRQGSKPSHRV